MDKNSLLRQIFDIHLGMYYTPNLKLACFVCYFKIINTFFFLKKIMYISYSKLSKELKNYIEILVGQTALKLWIKRIKILLWPKTQDLLAILEFQCYFWLPWTINNERYNTIFQKDVDNFEIEHKRC